MNFNRRTILKGMAAITNPLGLFKKAALDTANEILGNKEEIIVHNSSDDFEEYMVPDLVEMFIYGMNTEPEINNGILCLNHKEWDDDYEEFEDDDENIYFSVPDIAYNIARYYSDDFEDLIKNVIGGEGLYDMNQAFDGVFTKLFTNAANYMSPQGLARAIFNIYDIYDDAGLGNLSEISSMSSPMMQKIFNPKDIEELRRIARLDNQKFSQYFEKRGLGDVIEKSKRMHQELAQRRKDERRDRNNSKYSDHEWLASTHGGLEPGQSQYYMGDRVFENKSKNLHCFTEAYKLFIEGESDHRLPYYRTNDDLPAKIRDLIKHLPTDAQNFVLDQYQKGVSFDNALKAANYYVSMINNQRFKNILMRYMDYADYNIWSLHYDDIKNVKREYDKIIKKKKFS